MSATPLNSPANATVYRSSDPTQSVLRSCLDTMTEEEFVAVETDLGYHARTGMMTGRIRRILAALEGGALDHAA